MVGIRQINLQNMNSKLVNDLVTLDNSYFIEIDYI